MSDANSIQLKESIQLLSNYRDRLEKEIVTIANKLQIPKEKINATLSQHKELNDVKKTLKELIDYREKQIDKQND